MSEMSADQLEAIQRVVKESKEENTWPGTIINTSPLEVLLDGQGAPVPCLGIDFISLVAGRRCIVNRVGKDLVVVGTYGGPVLPSLTVTGDLNTSEPTALESTTGNGPISTVSGYAAFTTPAALVFVTGQSGRVSCAVKGRVANPTASAGLVYIGYEVRTGGTIGAGGVVYAPSNGKAVLWSIPASSGAWAAGRDDLLTLVPRTTYNVQAMGITSNGGGTFDADSITVKISPEP